MVAQVNCKRGNKHTYFKVTPPNVLSISTPYKLKYDEVVKIATANIRRIKPYLSTPSDKLHLLGKEYNLHILEGVNNLEVINDDIYIYASSSDKITIQNIVDEYYCLELKKIVKRNIEIIKQAWNFTSPLEIKFKNASSYFGECFFKKNMIILSTKLAKYEEKYIINVINHEMCHFYVHNHGEAFYQRLENLYPGFTSVQRNLKRLHYNDLY